LPKEKKMVVAQYQRAIGVLTTRQDAELALNELRESGFSMTKVGVLTKDSSGDNRHSRVNSENPVGTKAQDGTTTSTVRGGCGFLVGFGTLAIPGVGPAIAAGSEETAIAANLTGKSVKAFSDSWVKVLAGLGIPEQRASIYGEQASRGNYLLMVEGTTEEIAKVETFLNNLGIQDWNIYCP
jgi:hypothetical protein